MNEKYLWDFEEKQWTNILVTKKLGMMETEYYKRKWIEFILFRCLIKKIVIWYPSPFIYLGEKYKQLNLRAPLSFSFFLKKINQYAHLFWRKTIFFSFTWCASLVGKIHNLTIGVCVCVFTSPSIYFFFW